MHQIKLNELPDTVALTRAVLQISELLGLYQAELARVPGLHCSDIGAFSSAKRHLSVDTPAWIQARHFVALYVLLYQYFSGDSVAIYHWSRKQQPDLPLSSDSATELYFSACIATPTSSCSNQSRNRFTSSPLNILPCCGAMYSISSCRTRLIQSFLARFDGIQRW